MAKSTELKGDTAKTVVKLNGKLHMKTDNFMELQHNITKMAKKKSSKHMSTDEKKNQSIISMMIY